MGEVDRACEGDLEVDRFVSVEVALQVGDNKGQDFRMIQDWLGRRDPKHTSRYTRVAARRFEGVWD